MRIPSMTPARLCVFLLVLYPVSAILVWSYLAPERYGIMAALFAGNAATAVFVGLVFGLPDLAHYTSRALKLFVVLIGVGSGLASAVFWMAGEVDRVWLQPVFISPVVVILIVLMWFVAKAEKKGKKPEGEG